MIICQNYFLMWVALSFYSEKHKEIGKAFILIWSNQYFVFWKAPPQYFLALDTVWVYLDISSMSEKSYSEWLNAKFIKHVRLKIEKWETFAGQIALKWSCRVFGWTTTARPALHTHHLSVTESLTDWVIKLRHRLAAKAPKMHLAPVDSKQQLSRCNFRCRTVNMSLY